MGLLEMSFTGAVLIIAVILIRAAALNRLPKRTFLVLWGIVVFRLLVPFSFPSVCSIYSLMPQGMGDGAGLFGMGAPWQQAQWLESGEGNEAGQAAITGETAGIGRADGKSESLVMEETDWRQKGFLIGGIVWGIGGVLCFAFWGSLYIKCRRQFAVSVPVKNDFADNWIREHRISRPVEIRQSDLIKAPLTYGLRRPVILVPQSTDWGNRKQLEYILMHEYIHIKRFDVVTKLVLIIVLSVHWFNPFVWVMYILCNRDLELSCDEAVVRAFGENNKSEYAHILVDMEERKSGFMPLCNNFSKNAIEKRIIAIMKIKKKSVLAIVLAVVLVIGVGATFATSAVKQDKSFEEILREDGEEMKKQVGGLISEAEKVRYSLENWEFVVGSIEGNRADCTFYADWIRIRKAEDDPMIQGLYQAAEALTDEQERAYAIDIADGWLIEMQSLEDEERLDTHIVVLLDEKGKWSLYYPYVMDGVESLIPLEEYVMENWTEDENQRRQSGIDIIDGAIEVFREYN